MAGFFRWVERVFTESDFQYGLHRCQVHFKAFSNRVSAFAIRLRRSEIYAFHASHQLRNMLVFVFFDENAKDLHHRGERMGFVFARFVNQPVEEIHQLAIFAVVSRC